MIYVDPLVKWGAPWGSGVSCHLISDVGVGELLDFAREVGLPMSWFQHRSSSHPHFDLSPKWRARAVAAGAHQVDARGFVEAMRRFRAAERGAPAPPAPAVTVPAPAAERRARPRLNLDAPMVPDDVPGRQR